MKKNEKLVPKFGAGVARNHGWMREEEEMWMLIRFERAVRFDVCIRIAGCDLKMVSQFLSKDWILFMHIFLYNIW